MFYAALVIGLAWTFASVVFVRKDGPSSKLVARWTLLNIGILATCWIATCSAVRGSVDLGVFIALIGLGLPVLPLLAQFVTGFALYNHDTGSVRDRMSQREFLRHFVSKAGMMTSPPGLAIAMFGTIVQGFTDWNNPKVMILAAACVVALTVLWSVMWRSLRELSVPGRIVKFPLESWETDLFRLARRMHAPLKSVFLVQTRMTRMAGAFSFGAGRIGVTDTLLSGLKHDEFLAVMAHEMRHLTHAKDSTKILFLGTAGSLVLGIGLLKLDFLIPSAAANLLAMSGMMLVSMFAMSRLMATKKRHEDEADDSSVAFVGAEPMISALAKAYILNGIKSEKRSGRYRTLENRTKRLGRLGKLSDSDVELIMRKAHADLGVPFVAPTEAAAFNSHTIVMS